ncbi:MAG TPA: glycerate kinase, partial [Bacteroidota bacterium]|nr:glycerate kinase [Bacteroidota bacterium]
ALHAAEIIAKNLPESWELVLRPIADGGDGTLDCLVTATGGSFFESTVPGPLPGMKVRARWGALGTEKTAVIEMAEAAGLRLLKPEQYSAGLTTTDGVGELILRSVDAGYRKVIVGLGGSCTTDGGTGCVSTLGVRFLDSAGRQLAPGGVNLLSLQKIETTHIDRRLRECQVVCLSDVNSVLTGPKGTARVFAKQKGASTDEFELLVAAMNRYSELLLRDVGFDTKQVSGSGAAGGLGAGLSAFCRATIVSGSGYILDLLRFDELLEECDVVVTAEGRLDEQTGLGKGVAGITARARDWKKPVHVFAGRVTGNPLNIARELGVAAIHQISPPSMDDTEAMKRADELLGLAVRHAASTW